MQMSTLPITQALRAAAMALCLCLCTSAQAATLSYIGQQIVPTGTLFAGTTVGGLSGLDRDPLSGAYFVVSDDRSSVNPARFYGLNLDLSLFVRAAAPGSAGVQFQSVTTLLKPDGLPFAANTLDPESVRINPANGRLVWTNEGQRGGAGVPALQAPTVREAALDGSYVRDFAVPVSFAPLGSVGGNVAGDSGIRNNLAFESLSFSTDGRTLYTATENALVQDGPAAGVGAGSPSRILSFDVATGQAGAQWIYPVEPVALAPNPPGGFATNGLVELLAFGERQFIAVERSFAAGAAPRASGPAASPPAIRSVCIWSMHAAPPTSRASA